MSSLKERLRLALDGPPRQTQAALARACGIKPPSVNDWLTGKTQTIEGQNLLRAAAFLGVEPAWLATGKGPMRRDLVTGAALIHHESVGNLAHARRQAAEAGGGEIHILPGRQAVYAHHPEDPLPEDAVAIKESRLVKFSAGNGHRIDFELVEESEPAIYRRSWLQREGLNPEYLRRFKVCGDSMIPFLYENDSVLVNLAENNLNRVIDGKVYALRYDEDLRIKRLFRRLDGTLILRSDNPAYGDEPVPPHLAEEHITLIGRVRDKSGAGGL